jgi:predicted ABC-type transport system involved in lysophospholipase L1 biosynthesis ATPase subunit
MKDFVVLLGPSGSGKSSLLNILGGLDVPTSGHVLYRNTDLTIADEAALTAYRRRHVGFVFQFYNLIPRTLDLESPLNRFWVDCRDAPPRTARAVATAASADYSRRFRG